MHPWWQNKTPHKQFMATYNAYPKIHTTCKIHTLQDKTNITKQPATPNHTWFRFTTKVILTDCCSRPRLIQLCRHTQIVSNFMDLPINKLMISWRMLFLLYLTISKQSLWQLPANTPGSQPYGNFRQTRQEVNHNFRLLIVQILVTNFHDWQT